MGIPSVLTTDQGKEFHNQINRILMESFQIDHRLTTAYHPQANGLDERFNQTLTNSIAKVTGEERETWDEKIPELVYAYNTSVQVSVHCLQVPYSLEYTPPSNISPPSILPQICCTGTLHLELTPPQRCMRCVHVQSKIGARQRQTNTD